MNRHIGRLRDLYIEKMFPASAGMNRFLQVANCSDVIVSCSPRARG